MAFERIELVVTKTKAAAGLTITVHGKTVVALRKDLVVKAGFKADGKFTAMLGKDEDHGKLRIVKDKAGVACARELARTGAFFFNLGMVPAIGTTPHQQRPIDARAVEDGIEFDIPPDDGPRLLAPPAKPILEKIGSYPPSTGTRKLGAAGTTYNGVTIDATLDSESVSFKGKSTEVTTRQARLVSLLARPRPTPVAVSFLVAALWDGKPPQKAEDQVKQMADDLAKGLAPIGLNLCLVKGVGYQLKDA